MNKLGALFIGVMIIGMISFTIMLNIESEEEPKVEVIEYTPTDNIKSFNRSYECETLMNGFESKQQVTNEEILYWLNNCLHLILPNDIHEGEIAFSDLSPIPIGIAYCNTLELQINRGDKMWKDEIGDYFLWCVDF